MVKAIAKKIIYAKPQSAWGIISDYANLHHFHPLVKSTNVLSQQTRGLGAKRRFGLYNGTSADEEVIEWKEGSHIKAQITNDLLPVKNPITKFGVKKFTDNTSEVFLEMEYEPKSGIFGRLIDKVIINKMLSAFFRKAIARIEKYATFRELIEKPSF